MLLSKRLVSIHFIIVLFWFILSISLSLVYDYSKFVTLSNGLQQVYNAIEWILMLFASREVRIRKNCALCLEYCPQSIASGGTQDLGHSFS